MSRSPILVLALLLGTVMELAAQGPPVDLVPGRRIRVYRRAEPTLVGELVSLGSDSLTMTTAAADTVAVPRGAIIRLDLSTGTKSQAGHGAVTGLLIGAATGALIGVAASGSDDGSWVDAGPGAWALSGAIGFGAIGAGVGALIGAGKHTDRWEQSALPAVVVMPNRGAGTHVVLAWQFTF